MLTLIVVPLRLFKDGEVERLCQQLQGLCLCISSDTSPLLCLVALGSPAFEGCQEDFFWSSCGPLALARLPCRSVFFTGNLMYEPLLCRRLVGL